MYPVIASNLPFGSGVRQHRRSKAHLPTSAPLPGQPPGLISGRLCPGARQRSRKRRPGFPVAFRPPASASWASCSRRGVPLSSRSAYQAAPGPWRVGSGQDAVPVFRPARFPGPPSAPGVPITEHRALHRPRAFPFRFSYRFRPRPRDLRSPVAVAFGAHRFRVEQDHVADGWPSVAVAVTAAQLPPAGARVLAVFPPDNLLP